MGDLTQNFNRSEFACKCGCGLADIDLALVAVLQDSRTATALTYVVSSGCRCEKHNKEIGGKPNSAHLRGRAVDIVCVASQMRYRMIQDLIKRFRRIEIRGSWIHADIDSTLLQDVLFLE